MGNSSSQKTGSAPRRPSLAEREEIRAKKRAILDCLEFAGVPLDEQDANCKLLMDGNVTDAQKLVECTEAALLGMGLKPKVVELLISAQERFRNMPAQKPGDKTASSSGLPPVDPNAPRRKKSIAAGANFLNGAGAIRKASFTSKSIPAQQAPPPRTTKFIRGDVVEHYRESDNLIRRGKVIAVHNDDPANGVYYTIVLDGADAGHELQSAERKLEAPGVWQKMLSEKGISPTYSAGDNAGAEIAQEASSESPSQAASSTSLAQDATNDDDLL